VGAVLSVEDLHRLPGIARLESVLAAKPTPAFFVPGLVWL